MAGHGQPTGRETSTESTNSAEPGAAKRRLRSIFELSQLWQWWTKNYHLQLHRRRLTAPSPRQGLHSRHQGKSLRHHSRWRPRLQWRLVAVSFSNSPDLPAAFGPRPRCTRSRANRWRDSGKASDSRTEPASSMAAPLWRNSFLNLREIGCGVVFQLSPSPTAVGRRRCCIRSLAEPMARSGWLA